ncbi:MAG TPA: 1-(5-phosphoribosyl)-5-[(5-phosphoribosylamino)methylideneamino]imidazole-4-carboxamide isomerase [Acidimicrobiales bacterium]|jgi:phosphoribosylformimino-5-aminoimidazole carboxamide ribotide isomerase|nr:1-(5-phosphoribosyl)-5-[(5-phosphoribosylamino)methylideneamino]imidazole-4-carboxamide isomerase [Acidimicrobiales bacterium]
MDLYPAIDLRAGRAVRLYQGDYSQETVYGTDPVAVARSFASAGARWIHVVDLDAARSGVAENGAVVASIAGAVHPSVAVQSGGGVRSADAADALMAAGVARVVLGTAALESPDLVASLAARMPVAVGLDVRGREVAIRGWTAGSGADVLDVVRRFEDVGVEAVIVTQIARDGTLSGPDVDGLSAVLEATSLAVIASGGVGSLSDLETLASLSAAGRTLSGAIVGKALYEHRFTLEEALAVV